MQQHRGDTLTAKEAAEIRDLAERAGEREACERLAIHRATLARAIGRMHLQRATLTHIRAGLAALDGARTEAP